MDLTPENKAVIDSKGVEQLLAWVRFAPPGDAWMCGETGVYWLSRMQKFRRENCDEFVNASKRIGWVEPQNFENN